MKSLLAITVGLLLSLVTTKASGPLPNLFAQNILVVGPVYAYSFHGDGEYLTNLLATRLVGVLSTNNLPSNVLYDSNPLVLSSGATVSNNILSVPTIQVTTLNAGTLFGSTGTITNLNSGTLNATTAGIGALTVTTVNGSTYPPTSGTTLLVTNIQFYSMPNSISVSWTGTNYWNLVCITNCMFFVKYNGAGGFFKVQLAP